jgi:CubicO group peptidase (beta-lactamase class C family)
MRNTAAFIAGLLLSASTAAAQSNVVQQLDTYITPFANAGHFSGEVYVARNGQTLYNKAFGYANAELGVRNAVDTRIGIASITKMMTDVIVTNLAVEKKISFADHVSKFIPDFPNGDRITVDMLYRHRSGIPHRVMPPEMETVPYTSEEMIEKIKLAKLAFEPGTRRLYSSAGYTVLARVLELASGKSYSELLDQYVFKPAGMKNSVQFDAGAIIPRRANDYLVDEHGIFNAPAKDYSFLVGAGSVLSTAADVHAFAMAITNGAYGDSVRASYLANKRLVGTGSTNGHSAELRVDGTSGYSYAVVSNVNSGANAVIIQAIRDIMEGRQPAAIPVAKPVIVARTPADLAQYLGDYEHESGSGFTTMVKNGSLFAGDNRLIPTGKDCFFDFKYYGNVCFIRDGKGAITHIDWASPGNTSKWIRK